MMSLFDNDTILDAYLYEYGNEREARGKIEGKRETALNMWKKGYSEELIADLLEVEEENIKEWICKSSVKV